MSGIVKAIGPIRTAAPPRRRSYAANRGPAGARGAIGRRSAPALGAAALLALSLPSVCATAPARAQTLAIETRDAYDFADLARPGASVTIEGRLELPAGGRTRGAAILSHGAAGPGTRQRRAAERLAAAGIATLTLDHFAARGVGSTIADQLRVTEQTMLADLVAARAALAERLGLAPGRIGVVGWSKGATAALLAAAAPSFRFAAGDAAEPFAFVAAFYPFCGFALEDEALAAPLLLLLGGADDWTPAAPCRAHADAWREAATGPEVRVRFFPNARHGFDGGSGLRRVDRAITVRRRDARCTLDLGADGVTRGLDGVHDLATPEARAAWLGDCGVRGVTFGGDAEARAAALDALVDFVRERLR
ncbi:MAG: prolyl oligopeptidase family serine peptidase [Paracoccaceae bacterium]